MLHAIELKKEKKLDKFKQSGQAMGSGYVYDLQAMGSGYGYDVQAMSSGYGCPLQIR